MQQLKMTTIFRRGLVRGRQNFARSMATTSRALSTLPSPLQVQQNPSFVLNNEFFQDQQKESTEFQGEQHVVPQTDFTQRLEFLPLAPLRQTEDVVPQFNVSTAAKTKTTAELVRAVVAFGLCQVRPLVQHAPVILKLSRLVVGDAATDAVLRHTFYSHFCAGESVEQLQPVLDRMYDAGKVGAILDYAAEDDGEAGSSDDIDAQCDAHVDTFLSSIKAASNQREGAYVAIKLTALGRPAVLERISSAIRGGTLSADDTAELQDFIRRGQVLAEAAAAEPKVRLLFDAEQYRFQHAIDHVVLHLMKTNNTERGVVYNTYQCYLKDSYARMERHASACEVQGATFGAKLVRGAYLEGEAKWAAEQGCASPIHDTIEATHDCYNKAVRFCLEKNKESINGKNPVEVMCATHNQKSIELAIAAMNELGLDEKARASISFAQLYGMMDHVTYSLGTAGHRAYKYVPYGPIKTVLPYLLRRANENSAVTSSGAKLEMKIASDELKKRLRTLPMHSHKARRMIQA